MVSAKNPPKVKLVNEKSLTNSIVRELESFCILEKKGRFGAYIVVNDESRSLQSRDLSLWGGFGTLGFPRF